MSFHVTNKWEGGMSFKNQVRDHEFYVDAIKEHGGQNKGPSPKEFVLAGIMNCTSIDVVSLLKKMREPLESIEMTADASKTSDYPVMFKEVHLEYKITGGAEIKKENVIKAVTLSMTKYCGVSAMISKVCPIFYKVILNGDEIYSDQAKF